MSGGHSDWHGVSRSVPIGRDSPEEQPVEFTVETTDDSDEPTDPVSPGSSCDCLTGYYSEYHCKPA